MTETAGVLDLETALITGGAGGIGRETALVWLCSPAAPYVTGTVLPVDGGYPSK